MSDPRRRDDRRDGSRALRVDPSVRHPECWVIDVSSETDVDVLGRGVYHTDDQRANSHVTLLGDRRSSVDEAIDPLSVAGFVVILAGFGVSKRKALRAEFGTVGSRLGPLR